MQYTDSKNKRSSSLLRAHLYITLKHNGATRGFPLYPLWSTHREQTNNSSQCFRKGHYCTFAILRKGVFIMAIYHCSCKVISRSSSSSVGASAYRSGTAMTNEWNGDKHDYTLKGSTGQVVYSEVMLCENAPEEYQNREKLWNAVEQSEKRADAQLSREFEFALPRELSREEQIAFTREFVRVNFVEKGMCADINIHDKGDGNPHAHVMTTMRPIDEKGEWEKKTESLYLCKNKAGEERAFTPKELEKAENSEWKKQYHYSKNGNPKGKKVYLSEYEISNNPKYRDFERIKNDRQPKTEKFGKQNEKMKEWNSKEFLEKVRENLAVSINKELERKELPQRVDHRSYKRQGVDKIPTIHEGKSAREREDKRTNPKYKGKYKDKYKEPTEKIETNREIKKVNKEISATRKEIDTLVGKIQESVAWNDMYKNYEKVISALNKNPANETAQKQTLELIPKLEATVTKMVELQKRNGFHADEFYQIGQNKIPYVEYRAEQALQEIERIKAIATRNLVEIDMQRNPQDYIFESAEQKEPAELQTEIPKETALQQHQTEQAHADPNKSEAQSAPVAVESSANKPRLEKPHMEEPHAEPVRTFFEETPSEKKIYKIQILVDEHKEQAKAYASMQEKRNGLGLFQRKEKKKLDRDMLACERRMDGMVEELRKEGVSHPSKADEKIQELKANIPKERAEMIKAKENNKSKSMEAWKKEVAEMQKNKPKEHREHGKTITRGGRGGRAD